MTSVDDSLFSALREIARFTHDQDAEPEGRDRLIRFLDRWNGQGDEIDIVDSLCARFGLYPYMSGVSRVPGVCESLALEFHSPAPLAEDGFTFHAEQQRVYQRLMDGENVILSAPTSFGKSIIMDALIASEKWSNLVLIVPTLALIDETRRRLARFKSTYSVITHPHDSIGARNIVVMTQERFLEFDGLQDIDFFMIDEFYKLGSGGRNDGRRTLLNIAWSRLSATGAQYYLIGPNIDELDARIPGGHRDNLYRTEFKTVAVDLIDRSAVEDQRADLLQLVNVELDGSTLVFTGSPKKAVDLGVDIATVSATLTEGIAADVAQWIADNYDADWDIARALRGGVGVHTGPLPRGLQRIMVRLFNEGLIPVLVCTSTLIEGVNTAAKNVVIFEKKIDSQLIDFFTFSNIRGRAGRMFRHFVGRVVTYMTPPDDDSTIVDIPIETQSDLANDAALIQLDADALDEAARARLQPLLDQDELAIQTIRANRGLDPTLQVAAARRLRSMSATQADALTWSGPPTTEQARAALKFAFDELLEPYQRRGMNFNMMWGQLQNARANADDFGAQVNQQARYARPNQSHTDVIDDVLRFQRNWMGFVIPSMLRGLQAIQAEVLPSRGLTAGNYEFLLRDIESLYQGIGLVELEDYGLPLPLARKLRLQGLAGDDIQQLLESVVRLNADARVKSALSTVEQWILEDVVAGLRGP
jgi:hypothetical protein